MYVKAFVCPFRVHLLLRLVLVVSETQCTLQAMLSPWVADLVCLHCVWCVSCAAFCWAALAVACQYKHYTQQLTAAAVACHCVQTLAQTELVRRV